MSLLKRLHLCKYLSIKKRIILKNPTILGPAEEIMLLYYFDSELTKYFKHNPDTVIVFPHFIYYFDSEGNMVQWEKRNNQEINYKQHLKHIKIKPALYYKKLKNHYYKITIKELNDF